MKDFSSYWNLQFSVEPYGICRDQMHYVGKEERGDYEGFLTMIVGKMSLMKRVMSK